MPDAPIIQRGKKTYSGSAQSKLINSTILTCYLYFLSNESIITSFITYCINRHPGHSTWRVAHPKVAVLVGRILGLPLRLLKMVEDGLHESTATQASDGVCFDEATWEDVGGRGRYPKFEPHSSLFQFRTHFLDRFVNKLPLRHAHQMVMNDM